ncbi:MAG TPA: radical SAM family heme chaperone HemW [Gemmatimonadales bacterium]|nr:radical SAM family heme chaperone HemW [Gemmatimonadales bacterium]
MHISAVHLYLHVPFCARRCSYCDFAIAVRREVPTDRYVAAVLREWDGWQSDPAWSGGDLEAPVGAEPGSAPRHDVQTVYFGGGTPSLIDPAGIARLLDGIARRRSIAPEAEITLEANPDDVTPVRAAAWRAAGVNRISLGVQSFDPAVLEWMHRTHAAGQVAPAVEALRHAGFDDLSLDLIFGLPAALGRDWHRDLAQAFALAPEHLSLYGLTVEPHTPLGRWTERGDVTPVDEERYASEFLAADLALAREGYEHYEVSNAARPGRRARHNGAYWRRAPFIGLGPSAHSGFGARRQWNLREWTAYERAIAEGGSAVAGGEELSSEAVELEEIYLGLRTVDGLAADRLPPETVAAWTEAGWAVATPGRIRLTAEGWLRLDALAAATP